MRAKGPGWSILIIATVVFILAIPLLLMCPGPVPASPVKDEKKLSLSLWKNSYWYEPQATVDFFLDVENKGQEIKDVDIRLKLHRELIARSHLDQFLDGKWTRVLQQKKVIDGVELEKGPNQFHFNLVLPRRIKSTGIFPVTVELLSRGDVIASQITEVVVFSPAGFPPLDLVMLWDIAEPPQVDPQGYFVDDSLAEDCRGVGEEGWLHYLTDGMVKHENLRFTLAVTPSTLEELSELSGGYKLIQGDKVVELGKDSRGATDAFALLDTWRKLAGEPRFQFLPAPYSYPDLESLMALGWAGDVREQLSRGLSIQEEVLGGIIAEEYIFPPALSVDSKTLSVLKDRGIKSLVIGQKEVDRAPGAEEVANGLSISSPVTVIDSQSRSLFAAVVDERVERLIEDRKGAKNYRETVQLLIAELTGLFLERPAYHRMTVLLWPSSVGPSKELITELFNTLDGAPFLRTVTLGEAMSGVEPRSEVRIKIPSLEAKPDGYYSEVSRAKRELRTFSDMVFPKNPLLDPLRKNFYLSESYLWKSRGLTARGLSFVDDIVSTVEGELDKIRFTGETSIAITSEKAKLPISINNGTGQRAKVTLVAEAPELYFPEKSTWEQVLEPKENIIDVPVEVKKKGRFDLKLNIQVGDRNIDELVIRVSTSRFNLFALPVLGLILGALFLLRLMRIVLRRRAGKHKRKRRVGRNREKETPGA